MYNSLKSINLQISNREGYILLIYSKYYTTRSVQIYSANEKPGDKIWLYWLLLNVSVWTIYSWTLKFINWGDLILFFCRTKPDVLASGSVQQEYLRCASGRIRWLYPEGAVRLTIRPPTSTSHSPRNQKHSRIASNNHRICLNLDPDSNLGVNVHLQVREKLELVFSTKPIDQSNNQPPARTDRSVDGNRRCFVQPTSTVTLYLESFPVEGLNFVPVDGGKDKTMYARLPSVGAAEIAYDIEALWRAIGRAHFYQWPDILSDYHCPSSDEIGLLRLNCQASLVLYCFGSGAWRNYVMQFFDYFLLCSVLGFEMIYSDVRNDSSFWFDFCSYWERVFFLQYFLPGSGNFRQLFITVSSILFSNFFFSMIVSSRQNYASWATALSWATNGYFLSTLGEKMSWGRQYLLQSRW